MDFSGAQAIQRATRTGVTSGTPLYMAPEVLNQGAATIASDVYSLGVLLFFLVSGNLPIEAETVAQLRQAHAEGRRRRLRDLRPDVPDPIVEVIERAIAADASQRYTTAADLEHGLITASGSQAALVRSGSAGTGPARRWRTNAWTWVAAAAAIVAVAAGIIATWFRPAPPATSSLLTHFTIGPPYLSGSWPRVSPDGRYVVFGAIVEGRDRLWVRSLESTAGRPLMNTIATESPFWSPDSSTLCFFAEGKLKRIPVESGNAQPEVLADAPSPHGGDWSGQSIVFSREGGLYAIALDRNGSVSQVTKTDPSQGDYQHTWPQFMPDGRHFLFLVRSTRAERSGIYLGSLDGDTPRRVMQIGRASCRERV